MYKTISMKELHGNIDSTIGLILCRAVQFPDEVFILGEESNLEHLLGSCGVKFNINHCLAIRDEFILNPHLFPQSVDSSLFFIDKHLHDTLCLQHGSPKQIPGDDVIQWALHCLTESVCGLQD